MDYDPRKHHRRSIRLREWDYASSAAYFVTIVTGERRTWFDVDAYRQIVEAEWMFLPERFPSVVPDEFVVMANHVHFIVGLAVQDGAQSNCAPTQPKAQTALGLVVRAFKAVISRRIHLAGGEGFKWQRNYYERIIRNERELNAIRQYIIDNPIHWADDAENPDCHT